MSKLKSSLFIRIVIFILAILIVAGFLCYQPIKNSLNDSSYVMDNVATCSYNGKGKQELYGTWEFYYDQLIVSNNNTSIEPSEYISVPDKWSNVLNGKYPEGGYASYRAYVKNIPIGETITIGFDGLSSAYAIYINGEKISETGSIAGNEKQKSIFENQVEYTKYEVTNSDPIEIIIEVSTNTNGGLYKCPILFTGNKFSSFIYNKIVQKCIILGFLLIAIIMHLFYYITSTKEKRSLLSLLFIISLFFYCLFTGSFYSFFLVNTVSYVEFCNAAVAVLDIVISTILCIGLFTRKKLKVSIAGSILVASSYILMIIMQIFESTSFFSNTIVYSVFLGIRPAIMMIAYLFVFRHNSISRITLNLRVCIVFLCIAEFLVTLGGSGLFYDSTMNYESIFLCGAIIFSLISYFNIIKRNSARLQESDKIIEDNAQYKINLLLNQIKPHFLYNTLNSINILCKIDPDAASKAIVSFSNYLRNNMESISDSNLISINKELEHVKCYVDIEQIRFRERLKVKYDIKSFDFDVPPLSLQAIVENAIKHGVSSVIDGVTITIKTYEDNDYNYISIVDNGSGFDINSISESESVGLSNIIKRIAMLCNGSLLIKSRIGKGTTFILKLKKKD